MPRYYQFQNAVFLFIKWNSVQFRDKWTTDAHSNMDESQSNFAEWKKPDQKIYSMFV